jgi:uncharacterized protein with HEPN domain
MPRDERAYLADVIDSCEAIEVAVSGLDLSAYTASRLIRSSVEREFTIGEAIAALSRAAPRTFGAITNARRIIDSRSQLTHEYPTVDDALVWAIVEKDVPLLRRERSVLLKKAGNQEERE